MRVTVANMEKELEKEIDFGMMLQLILDKRDKRTTISWEEMAKLIGRGCSGEYLRKLSYGILEYHDYMTEKDNKIVSNRILCISDLHIPFNLPVSTFEKYKNKVDTLILNGDIVDMQGISKFPKLYRVSPMEELIGCRLFLIELIEMLKPKKVIVTNGNHEIRYGSFLAKNLDNETVELQPNSPMELIVEDGFTWYDKRNKFKAKYPALCKIYDDVEFVYPDDWKCQVGDTIFCHPFSFSSQPMKTGQKAYNWFLENGYTFKNIVVAHTHKVGNYMIADKNIYESGCCADIHKNNYTDGKLVTSQSCGFVYVEQTSNGETVNVKQEKIEW